MDVSQVYNTIIGNPYLKSLSILIIFFILAKIVYTIFEKIALKIAKKTKTDVDDKIAEKARKPVTAILLLIGIRLALLPYSFENSYIDLIEKIIYSFIIFFAAMLVLTRAIG